MEFETSRKSLPCEAKKTEELFWNFHCEWEQLCYSSILLLSIDSYRSAYLWLFRRFSDRGVDCSNAGQEWIFNWFRYDQIATSKPVRLQKPLLQIWAFGASHRFACCMGNWNRMNRQPECQGKKLATLRSFAILPLPSRGEKKGEENGKASFQDHAKFKVSWAALSALSKSGGEEAGSCASSCAGSYFERKHAGCLQWKMWKCQKNPLWGHGPMVHGNETVLFWNKILLEAAPSPRRDSLLGSKSSTDDVLISPHLSPTFSLVV